MTNTNQSKPTLVGPRVTLRAAKKSDAVDFQNAGRWRDISRMYGVSAAKDEAISENAAHAWLRSQMETSLAWVIEHAQKAIGALRFHSLDRHDQRASFAIGLFAPSHLGKGLGTEAMEIAFTHAFNTLNLNRISLRVLHFNERAIAAYKKLGFQLEGRERCSAKIGEGWHDDIIMGLLKSDFKRGLI